MKKRTRHAGGRHPSGRRARERNNVRHHTSNCVTRSKGRLPLKGAFSEPLPTDPLPLLARWIDEAAAIHDGDFNVMMLATATPAGAPSARLVLCKQLEASPPAAVFYTNYGSRKGRELATNPRAAGVLYWPRLKRQARLEGAVVRTSEQESDEYFRSRPLLSRIGAIASRQSRPLASRAALATSVVRIGLRPGAAAHRPDDWGGFRILLDRIELWCSGGGRLHDRVEWTRMPDTNPARWAPARLYP